MNNVAFTGVTLHYVDNNFNAINKCLAVCHTSGSHTYKVLAEHTTAILAEYGIKLDVPVHIVTDNASNMKVAMTKLMRNVHWQPCFAHTLQFVIVTPLESKEVSALGKVLSKARTIVGHYRRSPSAATALTAIQTDLNLPLHKLVQDVATRWNSQV